MARGTAAPPTRMRAQARQVGPRGRSRRRAARRSRWSGTPSEIVGRSSRIILRIGPPCRNIWGMISSTPAKNAVYTRPQALTWNIGTIEQAAVALAEADRVGRRGGHRVQPGGAVRVDDALGVARRARGVAHDRRDRARRARATRSPGARRRGASRSRASLRARRSARGRGR